ncbi:Uncharacterised protein [Candidatus Burarchaeum australiense]|nr:Uncharacterised protein [Candidatus Burarchaeum australiense]
MTKPALVPQAEMRVKPTRKITHGELSNYNTRMLAFLHQKLAEHEGDFGKITNPAVLENFDVGKEVWRRSEWHPEGEPLTIRKVKRQPNTKEEAEDGTRKRVCWDIRTHRDSALQFFSRKVCPDVDPTAFSVALLEAHGLGGILRYGGLAKVLFEAGLINEVQRDNMLRHIGLKRSEQEYTMTGQQRAYRNPHRTRY